MPSGTPPPAPTATAAATAFTGGALAVTMRDIAATSPDLNGLKSLIADAVSASRAGTTTRLFFGFPSRGDAVDATSLTIELTGPAPTVGATYAVPAAGVVLVEVLAGGKTSHWKALAGEIKVLAATATSLEVELDAAFGPDDNLSPGAGTFKLRGTARADDVAVF